MSKTTMFGLTVAFLFSLPFAAATDTYPSISAQSATIDQMESYLAGR